MWVRRGLYTYRVPTHLAVREGDIVSVSFGSQQVGAIAVKTLNNPPEGIDPSSIKPIESVINSAFFNEAYWQLLNRIACYYQTPFMRVIRTALPPGLLSKSQRRVKLTEGELSGKFDNLSINKVLSEPAIELIAILKKSPQKDYSWRHLLTQLRSKRWSARDGSSALRQLTGKDLVESYLAPPRSPQVQKRQAVVLIKALPAESEAGGEQMLSKRQSEILAAFAQHSQGEALWLSDALQLLQTTSKTLRAIAQQGYLVIEPREVLRSGSHSTALPDKPKVLTVDQAKALAVLHSMSGYGEALLHGGDRVREDGGVFAGDRAYPGGEAVGAGAGA